MQKLKLTWYWMLYSALLLLAGFGQLLRKVLTDTGGFSSRYSAVIVAAVIIIVLLARRNGKPLGREWFWRVVFALLSLACISGVVLAIYLAIIGVHLSAVLLLSGAILLAPALQQLYIYAFRSPDIWTTRARANRSAPSP